MIDPYSGLQALCGVTRIADSNPSTLLHFRSANPARKPSEANLCKGAIYIELFSSLFAALDRTNFPTTIERDRPNER